MKRVWITRPLTRVLLLESTSKLARRCKLLSPPVPSAELKSCGEDQGDEEGNQAL